MTMIERVADAIATVLMNDGPRADMQDVARAALAAMREPTRVMVAVAVHAHDDSTFAGARDNWIAMIDMALREQS